MAELQDLAALLRANTPLIVIETPDEGRVVELFRRVLVDVFRALYRWSITRGMSRLDMDREDPPEGPPDATSVLRAIQQAEQRGIYLLLDFTPYLGYAGTQRQLREIAQRRQCEAHTIVLVGSKIELPPGLDELAVRFELHLPDANALLKMVREVAVDYAKENGGKRVTVDPEAVKTIVRNLTGLSMTDAQRIARQLIFDDGALDANDIPRLAKLKFELLNRSGHLHFEYDTAKFADIAGAKRLKQWVEQRRELFVMDPASASAASPTDYPLDPPKGILLLGVQGCGKSLAAKSIAGGFGVPLVRLDFGTLYDKYHGETEKNLRQALASAEQIAPCVLWMDEIEKGLASGSSDADGGVSRRVLGYLLTWMAERTSRVFLVATANQVQDLPPELLRKGRFDETFFVDLPDATTREDVFKLHLAKRRVDTTALDLHALAAASAGFSGAEIEQAIVSALYAARAARGPLTQDELLAELRNTKPLSVLMAEQVQALRAWARDRTVPAD
ncbi:MAG TPA: AAA family ATPase [Xanthomonadaceae bacterium]|jgi:SpoVK/Ycf46/Vps4 family AAA+-type ATPase